MLPLDSHIHAFSGRQVSERVALAGRDQTFAEMYSDPTALMVTVDEVVSQLAAGGFGGGLVSGFAFEELSNCEQQNEDLQAHCMDKLEIGIMASVNPARGGWETVARRAIDRGAAGFGELRPGSQGWSPLGPAGHHLCELSRDAGVALQWHVSERFGHEYPGKAGGIAPEELAAVASRFPEIRQVGAHLGGGLPFYLQMPEVAESLRNVWFDTAASSLLYDDRAIPRVVDLAGPRRVLFGSDYPLLSSRHHLDRVLAVIGPEHVDAVSGGNLRDMFYELWER